MFRGLVNDAKAALSSLALKYLARASVAIPFIIALGFALAAISLMLIERFGSIAAYWIMAGGLAVVGVLAAVLVAAKEQEEEIADKQAEENDTAAVATDAAAQAIAQAPLVLLSSLLSSPGGSSMGLSLARVLGRNWALVLLLAAIAALFWPSASPGAGDSATAGDIEAPEPHPDIMSDAGGPIVPGELRP